MQISRRFGAIVHAIVSNNRSNAQRVILKDSAAAVCLCPPMLGQASPSLHCRFVSPKG
jgi:hypothetical protein